MDIPDYLANPDVDGQEWIKRKILASRWELRRLIEEVELVAEQYQMKKKYNGNKEDMLELKSRLRELLQASQDIAKQIRDMS